MRDEIVEVESAEAGSAVVITKQPASVKAEIGTSVTFTVEAQNVAAYQWQYSNDNGETWLNSGSKTKSITFTVNAASKSIVRRCVLTGTDGNTVNTDTVGILDDSLKITKQPESVKAEIGTSVTFSVEAENVASYQWQYSNDGETWLNSGSKTKSITFTVTAASKTLVRRCVLTGTDGTTLNTDTVGILDDSVKITKQPESIEAEIGTSVTFTVEAENVASYQWQYSNDDGTTWLNSGSTSKSITFVVNATSKKMKRRCVLVGNDGVEVTTDVVGIISHRIEKDSVTYYIMDDTSVMVESYSGTTATSVTIPETVEGYTVTKIGASAFENHNEIISIDLPETITVIGAKAFKNCSSLKEMH